MDIKDYVSLETAKLLKDKGFNESCICFYCKMHDSIETTLSKSCRFKEVTYNELEEGDLLIPSLYQAQKWLLHNHKLLATSFIKSPFVQPYEFIYCVQDVKNTLDDYGTIISDEFFETYEESLNTGILKALKFI